MKVAVEGCAHGDLENIYATIKHTEEREKIKIDLLLCCGDFQAVRNRSDLECLACPPKYRAMNSFWRYYSGEAVAPVPTIFIGGNHEASNYLSELYYGGWAAPNIFFLGFAGVVRFGGLRIGGLSGIFKASDYPLGHFERLPYSPSSIRSIYHIREYGVMKLLLLSPSSPSSSSSPSPSPSALDIFLSHDWPRGIAKHGDRERLLRTKPFFRSEVESNSLGSAPGELLLHRLKPRFWFAAHLHVKFAAVVNHHEGGEEAGGNGHTIREQWKGGRSNGGGGGAEKGDGSVHKTDTASSSPPPSLTKFLALDKCLPRRQFLQVLDFPDASGPLEISYDEQWLAITRATSSFFPTSHSAAPFPEHVPLEEHLRWVQNRLNEKGGSAIPQNFCQTAPPHSATDRTQPSMPSRSEMNPQTIAFMDLVQIPHHLVPGGGKQVGDQSALRNLSRQAGENIRIESIAEDEFVDDSVEDGDAEEGFCPLVGSDPNEIDLGDEEDDEE